MKNHPEKFRWTLPNILTVFRFVAAPGLLWLAWSDLSAEFLVLLAVVFLTDFLDGMTARYLGQVTRCGAILDSWADVITYLTISVCSWWLWPAIVKREIIYVILIVVSCVLPAIVGYLKFKRFTSYHTWLVKLAAFCMATSLYILFFGGSVWPFRIAAGLCVMAALEEIGMTILLPTPKSDLRSIWFILRDSKH
jgi:CDP-diacylglycerol--glycerol-3-phosphate 3-phosphatidyltransferase